MKTINQKLVITPEQYESIIWDLYSKWCQSVSITTREYQQVLANSAINGWFLMELSKCEKEFHTLTDRYTHTSVTEVDFANCYSNCVQKLFNIRPMALLSKIVKSKLKGTPVFNAINQN
jgi:hypothetical protein